MVDPPPREFVSKLTERGVPVHEVGCVIVATSIPYETVVLETIRDMSLELQIIFNKGAVMVLPSGVNKASGLQAALLELGLSPHNAVGVGDAENDEAFLRLCDTSAAVDNALEAVKKQVNILLRGVASVGVVELIEQLIADDLKAQRERLDRSILLGNRIDGGDVRIPIYGTRMLVTGDSAGGKSKLAIGLLEQLMDGKYQTLVIDPEGDYQSVEGSIVLGTLERAPTTEEVMHIFGQVDKSCVVSLFAAKTEEQPPLFSSLYRALQEYRVRTGRPHWNIVDEAHYPISASWKPVDDLHLEDFRSVMYVTAFPEQIPRSILKAIDLFVGISDEPAKLLQTYCELLGERAPIALSHGGEVRARLSGFSDCLHAGTISVTSISISTEIWTRKTASISAGQTERSILRLATCGNSCGWPRASTKRRGYTTWSAGTMPTGFEIRFKTKHSRLSWSNLNVTTMSRRMTANNGC